MTKPDKNHNLLLNTFDNKDKNIIKNETRLEREFGLEKIETEAKQSSGNQNYAPEQSSASLAGVELRFTQDEFTAKQIEKYSTKEQNQKFLPEPSDTEKASKTNRCTEVHQTSFPVELLDERFRVLEEGWGYYSRKKKPLFYKIEIMRFE